MLSPFVIASLAAAGTFGAGARAGASAAAAATGAFVNPRAVLRGGTAPAPSSRRYRPDVAATTSPSGRFGRAAAGIGGRTAPPPNLDSRGGRMPIIPRSEGGADPTGLRVSSSDDEGPQRVRVGDGDDFWAKQKELAASMKDDAARSLKEEQREKFAKRRLALVSESLFFSALIFSVLWAVCSSPFTPISYAFGAVLGTAYSYGLGKYVETLGGSADDAEEVQGAGVGQARFAFLVLLFVVVGRFRGQGLQEIPSIAGFFTYQLASLSQGLREIYDD